VQEGFEGRMELEGRDGRNEVGVGGAWLLRVRRGGWWEDWGWCAGWEEGVNNGGIALGG